jgi:hypothetical protein
MVENAAAVSATGRTEALPEPDELTVGGMFELLSDRRDRYALHQLRRQDGIADLRELAKQVLAWEAGDKVESYSPERVEEVVEEFALDRLPRLRRAGIVEYNLRTGCVVFTVAADRIEQYLDLALADEAFHTATDDPFEY